jgi:hypothetical protein
MVTAVTLLLVCRSASESNNPNRERLEMYRASGRYIPSIGPPLGSAHRRASDGVRAVSTPVTLQGDSANV